MKLWATRTRFPLVSIASITMELRPWRGEKLMLMGQLLVPWATVCGAPLKLIDDRPPVLSVTVPWIKPARFICARC